MINDISNTTEVDATLAGTVVDIVTNNNLAYKRVSTVIDGKRHFNNSTSRDSKNNLYAFTGTSEDYYNVSVNSFDALYELPNEAIFVALSREHTKDLNKTFDLPLPEIDYIKMLAILVSESGQYDLSEIANMDYINVNISALKDNELMLDWAIIAPTSGLVPKIENIDLTAFVTDDILNTSINTIETSISMTGFRGINGYQDYMNNLSERTVENYAQDKWSKLEWALFEMTIRDVSFESSVSSLNLSNAIKNHMSDTRSHNISNKKVSKKADEVANIISARLLTK